MSPHVYMYMYYHSELDKTMSDTVSSLDPRLGQVIHVVNIAYNIKNWEWPGDEANGLVHG